MADDNKSASDDDLLAALQGEAPKPETPESLRYVQRLIKMNPAMKPAGFNTEQTAQQLTSAVARAKKQAADKGLSPASAKNEAPRAGQPIPAVAPQSIVDAITSAKSELKTEQQTLAAQQTELRVRIQQCEKDIAAIEAKKQALASKICDAFIDRVLAVDRDLTSPKTQVILRSEEPFLTSIGFSIERFIAREKKR